MITPRFSVSQSDALVVVEISVPHIRVSAAEFHINDETFSFYCKPYLLKLSFPGALEDSEERPATAVYDPDKNHGTIVCSVPKQSPGEHFEDMDMMSKLLQPHLPVPTRIIPSASGGGGSGGGIGGGGGSSSSIGGGGGGGGGDGGVRSGGPLIEVISSEDFATGDGDGDGDSDGSEGSDGSGEGKLQGSNGGATTGRDPDEAARSLLWGLPSDMVGVELGKPRYGFNDEREGWFTDLRGELVGCVELPVPDQTPAGLRCRLREAAEKARFDGNRYQADRTYGDEDPLYQESRSFVPWWDHLRGKEEAATEEAVKGVPQPAVDALADGLGSLNLGVQSVGGSPSEVPPSDPPSDAPSVVSSSVLADAAALGGAANASPGGEGKGESESDAAAAAAAVVEAVVDSVAVNSLMGAVVDSVVDSVVDQASSIAVAAGASAGEQKGSGLEGGEEEEVEDGSSSGEYETSSEEEESSSAEEDSDWEFGGSSDDAMDSDDDLALFESTAAGVGQEDDMDTGAAGAASAAGAGVARAGAVGKGTAAGKGGGVDGGEAKEEVPSKPSTPSAPLPPATTVMFTETEREQMSKLPRKEQLVVQDCQAAPMGLHHWALLASVADVIFGYETEEPTL
jgi:hypothetical protein